MEVIKPESHASREERRLYQVHSKLNLVLANILVNLNKLLRAN